MRITKHSAARWTQFLATLFASLVLASCGGLQSGNGSGGSGSNPVVGAAEVTVSPSNAVIRAGDGIQFTASVKGAKDQSVTWSVNGVAGGNSTLGTVTA